MKKGFLSLLLSLFVAFSYGQYHNVKGVRIIHDNDSTGLSGVGMIRWDKNTGKFRFWDGDSWFSYGTSGASSTTVLSGTYEPTITGVANVDSGDNWGEFFYTRVGDVVTVSGWLTINPTATDVLTQLEIELPVASDFTTGLELIGLSATTVSDAFIGGTLSASVANNTAILSYKTATAGSHTLEVRFSYQVV